MLLSSLILSIQVTAAQPVSEPETPLEPVQIYELMDQGAWVDAIE